MKARTIGPLLMMTMGAAIMLVPATSWVGAGDQTVCDTKAIQVQEVDPCDPCETINPQLGSVDPCIDTVPETTGLPDTSPATTTGDVGSGGSSLPETGSSSLGFVVLGGLLVAAGGALLVTGRRTPDAV